MGLFASHAHASTWYTQTTGGSSITANGGENVAIPGNWTSGDPQGYAYAAVIWEGGNGVGYSQPPNWNLYDSSGDDWQSSRLYTSPTSGELASATFNNGDIVVIEFNANGSGGFPVHFNSGMSYFGLSDSDSINFESDASCSSLLCAWSPSGRALKFCLGDTVSDVWNSCGGAGGDPNSISFAYPLNGQNTTDFRSWVLSVSTNASSTFGNVTINYGTNSSSLQFSDGAQYSAFVSSNPFVLQKSVLLNPIINLTQTSTWYAKACYSGTTFSSTCTSMISFVIDPRTNVPQTTSSVLAGTIAFLPLQNPSATSTNSLPYSDCSLQNFGGCLVNAGLFLGNFFLQPTVSVQNYLNQATQNLENVFPFSIMTGVVSQFQSAISTATYSPQNLVLSNWQIDQNTTTSIVILSSSTTSSWLGSRTALLTQAEDYFVWFLVVSGIFFTVYHHFHKPPEHNQQP